MSLRTVPFPGLLTLVFVIFKLMGKIDWSWWLVFSPILIMAVLSVVIAAMAAIAASSKD